MTERNPIENALKPKSIAVIGASDRLHSRGSYIWRAVAHCPLAEHTWAINPKYKYIGDHPCYPSIEDVPETVDLAVICLRGDRILGALEQVGQCGISTVLIASEEGAYPRNREWMDALRAIRDRYRLRIIGPDSIGLMTPGAGVNVSYWPELPHPGNIALIAQSGMIATSMLDYAQEAELGFSGVVSTGAEIDIELADLIDYFARDTNTRVIALHIESVRHPRRFYSALRNACTHKHVVVLKAGSGSGYAADRLASFKFGVDAGSDEAFDSLIQRAGALRVSTMENFTAATAVFATNRLPRGNRLAVITNGAGLAALTADATQSHNIDLHGLSCDTIKALREAYPSPQLSVNPINVGATASSERYKKTLQLVLQDPMIDGAVVVVAPSPTTTIDPTLKLLAKTAAGSFKPVITAWVSDRITRNVRQQLRSVPNSPLSAIQSPAEAVTAFACLALQARQRDLRLQTPVPSPHRLNPVSLEKARQLLKKVRSQGRHKLLADECCRFLSYFGLQSVPTKVAPTLQQAITFAEQLGYPVALKVLARGIGHKADLGGVHLNLHSALDVQKAWHAIKDNLAQHSPLTPFLGVIVQPMVTHNPIRELRLAITHDHTLGPTIEFGAGGLGSNLYHDRAVALPPLSMDEAARLIQQPTISRSFGEFRGVAPINQANLAELLTRLSDIAVLIPAITNITINPLIMDENGGRILDAAIQLNEQPMEPDAGFSHLSICPAPIEYDSRHGTPRGPVHLRALTENDFAELRAFIDRLSDKSLYLRFHAGTRISDERVVELCVIDYERESAWVVADDTGIHGVARWRKTATPNEAEFGIVIEDAWQRNGLAKLLMRRLVESARQQGIRYFVGHVLRGNEAMHATMSYFGFTKGHSDSRDTDPWIRSLDTFDF